MGRKRLRRVVALAVLALPLLLGAAPAAEAVPVGCGQVITTDTNVSNDLSGCPGDGIVIGADGIAVDLQGHTFDGGPGAGINFAGHDHVVVRNGRIEAFGVGVRVDGDHNLVADVTTFNNVTGTTIEGGTWNEIFHSPQVSNWSAGIRVSAGSHNTIRFVTATNNFTRQIELVGGDHNSVLSSTPRGDTHGIFAQNETADTFEQNSVSDFAFDGIRVNGGSDNVVRNNRVSNAQRALQGIGIFVLGSSGAVVTNNKVTHSGQGIGVSDSQNVLVRRNILQSNSAGLIVSSGTGARLVENTAGATTGLSAVTGEGNDTGISVADSAANTLLERNTAHHNDFRGILVEASAVSTLLRENNTNRNGSDGISEQSGSATLTANLARFNGGFGIFATPGDVDGGGNHATGNAAGQCVNLTC